MAPALTCRHSLLPGTNVDMVRVESEAIEAVGYDRRSRRMKIRFTGGKTYDYCAVPEHLYLGLMRADSHGAYFNQHIRDKYEC